MTAGNVSKLVCLHYTVSFSYSKSKNYLRGLRGIIEICNHEVDFKKSQLCFHLPYVIAFLFKGWGLSSFFKPLVSLSKISSSNYSKNSKS